MLQRPRTTSVIYTNLSIGSADSLWGRDVDSTDVTFVDICFLQLSSHLLHICGPSTGLARE